MQDSWSSIKESGDFLKKFKNIGKIPEGAILVTSDVFGLCPSISHGVGLEALRKRFNERDSPKIPTENLVRVTYFVFLNSTVRLNSKNQEQLLAEILHLLMLVSSCMKERQRFLKIRNYNLSFGSISVTIYFLYELTEKKSSLSFLMNLIIFIPI